MRCRRWAKLLRRQRERPCVTGSRRRFTIPAFDSYDAIRLACRRLPSQSHHRQQIDRSKRGRLCFWTLVLKAAFFGCGKKECEIQPENELNNKRILEMNLFCCCSPWTLECIGRRVAKLSFRVSQELVDRLSQRGGGGKARQM